MRPTLAALIKSAATDTSARKIGGRRTSHRGEAWQRRASLFLSSHSCLLMKTRNAWPESPLNYVTKSSRKAQRRACYCFGYDVLIPRPSLVPPHGTPEAPPNAPRLAGLLIWGFIVIVVQ